MNITRKAAAGAEVVVGAEPRVNLMPQAEYARRDRERTLRRWGWGLVAALAVVAVVAAGSLALSWSMTQQLAGQQAQSTVLLKSLSGLSDVSNAQRTQQELKSFRSQAMASDIAWGKLDAAITAALPAGVTLTGFELAVGGVPATGTPPAAQVGLIGQLTLTSAKALQMAEVIRALRDVAGVSAADGTQLASGDAAGAGTSYTYTMTITFDQSVYTGRFATKGGN